MKQIGFLAVWLLLAQLLPAQQAGLRFEKITSQDGLTSDFVTAVLQDRRGFLWIGSAWGLNRYDGRVIRQYVQAGAGGLTDLKIICLAEDTDGFIWAGTENGLNRIDPVKETITQYRMGSGSGTIPYNWCNRLYVDQQQQLWLTTEKGLARYDAANNSFTNYPIALVGGDDRSNRFILDVFEDSRERFWLATSFGIKQFDRNTHTITSFHAPETGGKTKEENITTGIFEDAQGDIYAHTWSGWLLRWNGAAKQFEKIAETSCADVMNTPAQLERLSGSWLATASRINGGHAAAGRPMLFTTTVNSQPVYIWLHKSLTDRQGIVWVATRNGLFKADPANQLINWMPLPGAAAETAPLYHIIPNQEKSGRYYYLTSTAGWWRYDEQANRLIQHPLPANGKNALLEINNYVAEKNGWWFTSQKGMGFYDVGSNTAQLVTYRDSGQATAASPRSWAIAKDNLGRIWFSVYRDGIRVYDPAAKKISNPFAGTSMQKNLRGRGIAGMLADETGHIWFIADRLYRVNAANFAVAGFAPDDAVPDIRQNPVQLLTTGNNRLLVVYPQKICSFQGNRLSAVFPLRHNAPFLIEKIAADRDGFFWMQTNTGIFRTDAGFTNIKNMGAALQVAPQQFVNEIHCSSQGACLLAGMGRLGFFRLEDIRLNTNPPAVLINRVKAGAKEYFLPADSAVLRLLYKDAAEFEISALNFSNEKSNRVFYQLSGWDTGWKELAGTPVVRYQQLPPGRYTFRARGRNSDGVWSSRDAVVAFSIKPPFYKTGWFAAVCAAVAGVIMFGVYRYRLARAVEMEKLRTRIATDLHDDIGATLSSISMYSETLKTQVKEQLPHLEKVLDRMGENSRNMVGNMSDIVWAINPANDDGQKLLSRAEDYARDICAAKNIRLYFAGDDRISQLPFSPEQRRNLYLVFKEAVNNAVKYSQAAHIRVNWLLRGRQLTLVVMDDGCGFDATQEVSGNGLRNMRQRAAEMKADITITPRTGGGTEVRLQCAV